MDNKNYLCCPLKIQPLEKNWIVSGGKYQKKLNVGLIHLDIFRLASVPISENELTDSIVRKYNVSHENVKQVLCELLEKGFLVCSKVMDFPKAKNKVDLGTIDYLGIITCDRPQALCESLEAYIKNANNNGHNLSFFVVDDSRYSQKENRENITRIAQKYRCSIGYVGDEEKLALIQLICEYTGISKELISFAFYPNKERNMASFSAGAARNCGAALCAGTKYLLADDDSMPVGNYTTSNRKLSFSQGMPHVLKSLDKEGQIKECNYNVDAISYISRYLGKSTREVLEESGSIDVDHYHNNSPVLMDKYRNYIDSRIGFSMCTIQGVRDISVDTYLEEGCIQDGWYFERTDSDCICSSPLLLTTTLTGFDPQYFVTPFFPIFRNEDVMTSMFLNAIDPYALSVVVNVNLWHKKDNGHKEIACSKSNFYEEILFPMMLECILQNYRITVHSSIIPYEKQINMIKEYIEGICGEDSLEFISNICKIDHNLLEKCSRKIEHIQELRRVKNKEFQYWLSYPKSIEEMLSSHHIREFRETLIQYVKLLQCWGQILDLCKWLNETCNFPVTKIM